ncbi:MAG: hypothetical protein ACXWV8_14105, partial [Chitinophagaceae bacterium]
MRMARVICALVMSVVFFYGCGKKDSTTPPPVVTPPGCATHQGPLNGAFVTTSSVTLTWSSVSGATGYDVYLGTTPSPTTVIASNVTATNYNYSIPATPNITYYWYVVPKSAAGAAVNCASA